MANNPEMKGSKASRFIKRLWRLGKKIFLWLFFLQFIYIFLLKWVNPPITITQLSSWVGGYGLKRDYINGVNMSSNARLAVISSEDQLFPDHNGFDWKSIQQARKYNEKKPGRIRGASTISQQVAKNVFLWQGRSWIRKGLEVYFTYMIEWIWGKKRILEVYLNVIEMGKGIFGVEMAAQQYFNKPAKNLSRHESALIAACLPGPKIYKVKPVSNFVAARSQWILGQMNYLQDDPDIQAVITKANP
jgi:monofunctional biosynthetic peptidoglycan transglycosylase